MKRLFVLLMLLSAGLLLAKDLPTCYHTYAQVGDMLTAYQAANPEIAKLVTIGFSQQEHVPIYAMKLSGNVQVEAEKPALLFIGQVHAEEVMGVQIVMSNIKEILTNQAQSPYAQWLTHLELWFIPTLNPEGHNVVTSNMDTSYRKNKRDNNNNGIFDFSPLVGYDVDGVDINRNLSFNWVHGDSLLQPGSLEVYDYYRGPAPMSESEVHAFKALCDEQRFVYSIVWHSSRTGLLSEKVYFPFNWKSERPSPDVLFAQSIGAGVAAQIMKEDGSATYESSPNLSRKGATHDWMYQQYGTIQVLIECATRNLQPDSLLMVDTVNRCSNGVRWMINRAMIYPTGGSSTNSMLTGRVTDASTGLPLEAQIIITERDAPWFRPRTSDPDTGKFWKPLATGSYHLKVKKEGYQDYNAVASVNSSAWTTHPTIALQALANATFAGTVKSAGTLIPARIIFKDMHPDTLVVDGTFIHPNKVGTYPIEIFAQGYFPYLGEVTLVEGYNHFNFNLSPATEIMSEDWSSGTDNWEITGPWVLQNELSASGYAITDSWGGNGFYAENCDVNIAMANPIFIPSSDEVMLHFDSHLYTEWNFDPCTVEASTDGVSWTALWTKSGLWDTWAKEYVPLGDYAGMDIRLRFRLRDVSSHVELTDPGWTIDNIKVVRGYSTSVANSDPSAPQLQSVLYPNYPNPFNPETKINFTLSSPMAVRLEIFNLKGQLVRKLVDSQNLSGEQHIVWNGTDDDGRGVSSGVYYYRLTTPQKVMTRKMALVK